MASDLRLVGAQLVCSRVRIAPMSPGGGKETVSKALVATSGSRSCDGRLASRFSPFRLRPAAAPAPPAHPSPP